MISWPYQSTPYLSALPGVAGPGMDFGGADLPSKLYFVTSYKDTKEGGPDPRGPNCFSGTERYCWQADQGEWFHKFVFPFIGGYVYLGRSVATPYGRGNMDYVGHAAPGAGLFIRCAALRQAGGSNVRIWNLPSWVGDEPSADGPDKFRADMRDALQFSMDGYKAKNCANINCESRFFMDEGVEIFYAMDGCSWIRSAIYDPLHIPPGFAMPPGSHHEAGEDHGFGHVVGGSDFCDHSLVMQSIYGHTTDRNPLVAANNHSHVNVLHYDHGRTYVGAGAGLNVQDNGGFNAAAHKAMQCNLVGSVSVRGPNNNDGLVFASATNVTPGSSGHSAHNAVYGWNSATSQDDFFTKKPAGYLQPTLRTSAWPAGLGSDYSGVLKPFRDSMNPTVQEGLAFVQLMRETVGVMPSRRYLYKGALDKVFDQIEYVIRGGHSDASQWVNTVLEAGGWPAMPTLSVDPLDPGSWYHAPIPLGADRDEVLLFGLFSDGSSKVGYTKLRAWIIEQYLYTQGR